MVMLSNFQIALALQILRERNGISAEDLNSCAGLAPGEVGRIEGGEIGLDYLTAARLTNVLHVALAEIATTAYALDPVLVTHRYEQFRALNRKSFRTGI